MTEVANIVGKNVILNAGSIGSFGQDRAFTIAGYTAREADGTLTTLEMELLATAGMGEKTYDHATDTWTIRLDTYAVRDYLKKLNGSEDFTELDKYCIWTSESPDVLTRQRMIP